MNAPHHAVELKRQDWAEQTTCRAFMLYAGKPDGDDVSLMLDVLADHWERISGSMPEHAHQLAQDAHDAILLAFKAVDAALEEADTDPRDIRDAERSDWNARLENVRGA